MLHRRDADRYGETGYHPAKAVEQLLRDYEQRLLRLPRQRKHSLPTPEHTPNSLLLDGPEFSAIRFHHHPYDPWSSPQLSSSETFGGSSFIETSEERNSLHLGPLPISEEDSINYGYLSPLMLTLSTSPFLSPLPLPDLPGINDQSKSSHTSRAAPTISLPSPPLTPETVPTASDDSLAAEDDDSDDDSDDDDDSISEESFSDEYQSDSEDSDDDYSPPASSAFPKKKPLSKYSRPTFKRRASSNAASSTLSRLSSFSPAPGATHLSASPSRSSASAEHLRVQEAVIRTFKQRTLQSPSASASSSPRSLPSSSKQCSEPRTHPCSWPGCDVAFTRQPDLNRHFMIHSSDPEKPKHVCTGVPVDRAGDFGIKDTSAMEVYSFKDEVWIGGCFKGFSRRDALKRHVERNSRACIGEIAPGKMYGAKAKPGPKSRRRSQ